MSAPRVAASSLPYRVTHDTNELEPTVSDTGLALPVLVVVGVVAETAVASVSLPESTRAAPKMNRPSPAMM
jgi:hypothetical protein